MYNNRERHTKRSATGKTFTEVYDSGRMDRLKQIIHDFKHQGRRKRYSILVDGEMVVAINSSSENFDGYKNYLESDTRTVEVRMYFGESPNFNRHVFQLNSQPLAGISKGVDEQIENALERQELKHLIDDLKKKIKRKNKKIKAYEDLIEKLNEKEIDFKSLVKEGMELFGQFRGNKSASPVDGAPEKTVEVEVTPEEKSASDKQFQSMKTQYGEEGLMSALKTWEIFSSNPDLQEKFTELINQKNK